MNKVSRNYGIDLLRVVSILGVVFLHVLGHGGVLASAQTPARFSIVWFFEILAYPAVNCFVLISGFVGYRQNKIYPKLKNIISLFFTVVFYGALICLIFKILQPERVTKKDFFMFLMPITYKKYWFFTAYFGMFILSPILNAFVYQAKGKQLLAFLIVVMLCSTLTLIKDSYNLMEGYSVIWFVLLYLLGAIIKKYDLTKMFSFKTFVALGICAFLFTWGFKICSKIYNVAFFQKNVHLLISYVSPTVLLMAIAWLGAFSKIKCPKFTLPLISFLSTSAFSVYLIHDNIYIRNNVIANIHKLCASIKTPMLPFFIIGCVLTVFIVCTLIDKVKILLFNLVKADKIAEFFETVIKKVISNAYNKIKRKAE